MSEIEHNSIEEISEMLAAKGYILFFAQTPVPEYVLPHFIALKGDVSPLIGINALQELIETGSVIRENGILRSTE